MAQGGASYTPTVIGHRPRCAMSALERYAEFPRQERLDSLRPHLVKHGLFPAKLDPETAAITMTELKGLARIWKLHNERHFWRKNNTKDAIVLALHQHMQKARQLEKLKEAIVAKGRQKRDAHSTRRRSTDGLDALSVGQTEASLTGSPPRRKSKADFCEPETVLLEEPVVEATKKTYEYVPAHEREPQPERFDQDRIMIYRSRGFAELVAQKNDPRAATRRRSSQGAETSRGRFVSAPPLLQQSSASQRDNLFKDDIFEEQQLLVKRKCSHALLNMSTNRAMQAQFVEQGGLTALLGLATECADNEVVVNCAACLVNLIPYGDVYEPSRLLDLGVVRVLVRLALSNDALVRHCCALCLCRLSAQPGIEERLVVEGALTATTKLVQLFDNTPQTRIVAAKILVNLAAAVEGNQAESLVKHVLKVLGTMVSGNGTQQFCAEAIASLACLPVARPILAKQGVIATLKLLLTTALTRETTEACAAALCNMGQLHGCRKEMLALGLIRLVSNVLRVGPTEIQHLCTLCLTTLSFQKDLRCALLREGALRTIATVVARRADPDLTRHGACALLNFAFDPQTREDVVGEDGLPALMALLEADNSNVDEATRANALMALSNLLYDQATCPQVLETDVLDRLGAFRHHLDAVPSLHEYVSVALLNVSIHPDFRKCLAAQGNGCASLLLDLVVLDKKKNKKDDEPNNAKKTTSVKRPSEPAYVTNALKALYNLCLETEAQCVFIELQLLERLQLLNGLYDAPPPAPASHEPTLPGSRKKRPVVYAKSAEAPSDDASCLHLSALILHVLSTNKANHPPLLDAGVVSVLVKMAASPNEKTKTVVAGSLYNVTQCAQVTHEDFLTALMALSHSQENARVLWCAWCFANVSTFPRGRVSLGKLARKVIPTLLAMMRSGCADAERIQYHCSVAMCNLLSVFLSKDDILAMVKDGTMQDIIVITVLRANDVQTKQVLAQALFNLLTREDTRPALIKQDVPLALLRLTTVEDPVLNLLCVKMLVNLSCEGESLAPKLLEMKVVRSMVEQCLSPSGGVQIKKLCATTLATLSRLPAMLIGLAARESNIVAGVRSIAVVNDNDTLENVAAVVFNMSTTVEGRQALTKQDAAPVLVSLRASGPAIVKQLVIAGIANLTCDPASHPAVADHAMNALVETLRQPVHTTSTRTHACLALANLVVHYPPARPIAVAADAVPAMRHFVRAAHDDDRAATALAKIMRDITRYPEGLPVIAAQGAMALCARLAKREEAHLKHDVATAVCNLCGCKFAPAQIIDEGAVNALFWLTLQDCLNLTAPIFKECAVAVRYLAQHDSLRPLICMEDNLVPLLFRLSRYMECEATRYHTAVAVYFVLAHGPAQKPLCRAGIIKLLNDLAATGPATRDVCSAALHQLPNELLNNVDGRLLAVLMSLLTMTNADFTEPSRFRPDRSSESTHEWPLTPADYAHARQSAKAQWPTSVIARSSSAFVPAKYDLEAHAGEQVNPSRARGTSETIGHYAKMRHTCSQLTSASLDLKMLEEKKTDAAIKASDDDATRGDAPYLDLDVAAPPAASETPSSHRDKPTVRVVAADDDDVVAQPARLPNISADDTPASPPKKSNAAADAARQQAAVANAFPTSPLHQMRAQSKSEGNLQIAHKKPHRKKIARGNYTITKNNQRSRTATREVRQQDRIADDYYALLRHVV